MAHNSVGHPGYHWTVANVRDFAIHRLTKQVKAYIKYCHLCQTNQTRYHAPYGSYQPILTPDIPFYTITMDFIVGLPDMGLYNQILTITCKYTKWVIFVPGQDT